MSDIPGTGTEPANGAIPTEDGVRRHVEDALEFANFVVSTGAKGPDGQPLPFHDIATIQMAAEYADAQVPVFCSGSCRRAPGSGPCATSCRVTAPGNA